MLSLFVKATIAAVAPVLSVEKYVQLGDDQKMAVLPILVALMVDVQDFTRQNLAFVR